MVSYTHQLLLHCFNFGGKTVHLLLKGVLRNVRFFCCNKLDRVEAHVFPFWSGQLRPNQQVRVTFAVDEAALSRVSAGDVNYEFAPGD